MRRTITNMNNIIRWMWQALLPVILLHCLCEANDMPHLNATVVWLAKKIWFFFFKLQTTTTSNEIGIYSFVLLIRNFVLQNLFYIILIYTFTYWNYFFSTLLLIRCQFLFVCMYLMELLNVIFTDVRLIDNKICKRIKNR